jgi:hypothetical protein
MHWTASAGSMMPRGSAGVVKLLPVTATVACAGWQQHHVLLAPCPALWLFSPEVVLSFTITSCELGADRVAAATAQAYQRPNAEDSKHRGTITRSTAQGGSTHRSPIMDAMTPFERQLTTLHPDFVMWQYKVGFGVPPQPHDPTEPRVASTTWITTCPSFGSLCADQPMPQPPRPQRRGLRMGASRGPPPKVRHCSSRGVRTLPGSAYDQRIVVARR